MDLKILNSIKNDINCFGDKNKNELLDILNFSWEYLTNGHNKAEFKSLAHKANLDLEVLEASVTATTFLLLEISKCQVSEDEFLNLSSGLNLSNEVLKIVYQFYVTKKSSLSNLLQSVELNDSKYRNLQWRLESELGSRSLRGSYEPRVVMKLDLERQGVVESVALVSDIPNIIHWSQMVEQALQEGRTQNARRIKRAVS